MLCLPTLSASCLSIDWLWLCDVFLLKERVLRDGLQVIVFCSSVESTHRLARLLEVYGGFPGEGVYEFSRNVSQVCSPLLVFSTLAWEACFPMVGPLPLCFFCSYVGPHYHVSNCV